MSNLNQAESFNVGCTLFYAAHWFQLGLAEFRRLVVGDTDGSGLEVLVGLVGDLQRANPDDHNASVEQWCSTPNIAFGGLSPAALVAAGRANEVRVLVSSLGQLPSCHE